MTQGADVLGADPMRLLDDLQNLLSGQLEAVRRGNLGKVERMGVAAEVLVARIVSGGILGLPGTEPQRRQLEELYKQVSLALAGRQSEVGEELRQVRLGRKVLETYHAVIG